MSEATDGHCLEFTDSRKRMTDEELAAEIEETFRMKAAMIRNEPKESRDHILESIQRIEGVSTRQLSRVSGVSTGIVWALSSGRTVPPLYIICKINWDDAMDIFSDYSLPKYPEH